MMNAIDFIPHDKPMVFVDHLIEADDLSATAELTITSDLMFCEAEGLPTWASIEIMAQTVSAYAGYRGKKTGNAKPKVGFLLGTRKMQFPIAYFALNDVLKIHMEQSYLHEGLGQFQCVIQYQEHEISAMLSVYEPPEIDQIVGNLT